MQPASHGQSFHVCVSEVFAKFSNRIQNVALPLDYVRHLAEKCIFSFAGLFESAFFEINKLQPTPFLVDNSIISTVYIDQPADIQVSFSLLS